MKKILRNSFLRLRKIFISEKENLLFFFLFFIGLFLIFLANSEIKKLTLPQAKEGGFYREALFEDMSSFNPFFPKNDSQKALLNLLYPPLIEFDNGKLISKFIKSYSVSTDKLSYTFFLKDLKWSDGKEITSEDFLFFFKNLKKLGAPEISYLFKEVDFEILDKKSFVFRLKNNNNYFLYHLKYLRALPAKTFSVLELTPENLSNFPKDLLKIGSGPFVLESWQEDKIILKRNEFYQPKPYLAKVIFYLYPSAKRAFDALLLKEVDGLSGVNYFHLPSNLFHHFKVYKITLPRVIGIFFNTKKVKPQDFVFLNQLDRSELNKLVFASYAEETTTLFSPTIRKILGFENPSFPQNENVPQKSKLKLLTPSLYFYPEIARYLRDKFGFEIEFVDNETFNQRLKNKDYEAVLMGLNYDFPPAPFYFWSQASLNLNNLENLEFEKKLQNLITQPSLDLFAEIKEVENSILALKTNVFLLNPYYLYFLNKEIVGFDQYFLFAPEAKFVKIEYWFKRK